MTNNEQSAQRAAWTEQKRRQRQRRARKLAGWRVGYKELRPARVIKP